VGTVTVGGWVPKVPAAVGAETGGRVEVGVVAAGLVVVVGEAPAPVVDEADGLGELPQAAAATATVVTARSAEILRKRMPRCPFLV
jgi:hypothetical protein